MPLLDRQAVISILRNTSLSMPHLASRQNQPRGPAGPARARGSLRQEAGDHRYISLRQGGGGLGGVTAAMCL